MGKKLDGYKVDIDIDGLSINTNLRSEIRKLLNKNNITSEGQVDIKIENDAQREAIKVIFSNIVSDEYLNQIEGISLIIIKGKITSFEFETKGEIDGKVENIIHSYKYVNNEGTIIPELRGIYQKGISAKKLKKISDSEYEEIPREVKVER